MQLNTHPAVPPRSVIHTQLVERATRALTTTQNPERKQMLTHLLDNTLRFHCKVDNNAQLAAIEDVINGIITGRYTTFKEFSTKGLQPYVKKHFPTPPKSRRALGLNPPENSAGRLAAIRQQRGQPRLSLFT